MSLKYGSQIQLFANSSLSNNNNQVYSLNYYEKHDLLALGAPDDKPLVFTIVPTSAASGDDVCYGHRVILLDNATGRVFNSNASTWGDGYTCLKDKKSRGEMHIMFKLSTDPYCEGHPILLKDVTTNQRLQLIVISAKGKDVTTPRAITLSKKDSSAVRGGYIMHDHTGVSVTFNISVVADKSATPATPSQSQTNSDGSEENGYADAPNVLKYGDRVKIKARSQYYPAGGYIGVYNKHNLVAVGPAKFEDKKSSVSTEEELYKNPEFSISEFVVVSSNQARPGDIVRYGASIVLVDIHHHAQIWNNKLTDTWGNGYVALKPISTHSIAPITGSGVQSLVSATLCDFVQNNTKITPGQMHISFQPSHHSLLGLPVQLEHQSISIDVENSHRNNIIYNTRLSVYKKSNSLLLGGYLISAKNGKAVTFSLEKSGFGIASMDNHNLGVGVGGAGSGLGIGKSASLANLIVDPVVKSDKFIQYPNPKIPALTVNKQKERARGGSLIILPFFILLASVSLKRDDLEMLKNLDFENLSNFSSFNSLVYFILILLTIGVYFSSSSKYVTRSAHYHANTAYMINEEGLLNTNTKNKKKPVSDAPRSPSFPGPIEDVEETPVNPKSTVVIPPPQVSATDWETDPVNCVVPERFINAEKGDVDKGRARYIKTMKWRKDNNIDTILSRPHPMFRIIKKYTNHYFFGKGKQGNCAYYETPKAADLPTLKKLGVTIDDLLYHFVYISEYLYQVMDTDENARCISVVDLTGIGLWDFRGEVVDYVKKVSNITSQHYPERSFGIVCINSASSFRMIWAAVSAFMDPVTKAKTKILGNKFISEMTDVIDIEQIAPQFGGRGVYNPTITADALSLPEGSIDNRYNNIHIMPCSEDEEGIFYVCDEVNRQFANENPGQMIPRPTLVGVSADSK